MSIVSMSRGMLLTLSLAAAIGAALLVALGCVEWGQHGARQCAIDYPHEGQCGLVGMEGLAFAFLVAPTTLIAGVGLAIWNWRRSRQQSQDGS
jgi:hypothetical protein